MPPFFKSKFIYYVVSISFVAGIYWGVNRNSLLNPAALPPFVKTSKLSLLLMENTIPQDILESFEAHYSTKVVADSFRSSAEFESKMANNKYDIVSTFPKETRSLILKNEVLELTESHLNHRNNISVDFKNLPFDPHSLFGIPLLWGVSESSATSYTDLIKSHSNSDISKASNLWILSLLILKSSSDKKSDHLFIDYLLSSDVSFQLSQNSGLATTNRALESRDLPEALKASYIRKLPIRNLHID